VKRIADTPSYFLISRLPKGFRVANPIYETEIEEAELAHFTSSREAADYGFFTKEEAEKLQTNPNVQEFVKIFTPNNH
jgi:hypothetical protein